MTKDGFRMAWEPLKQFTQEVFTAVGLPPQDAEIEAEVLVWANLRGVDSHGVLRIPRAGFGLLLMMPPTPSPPPPCPQPFWPKCVVAARGWAQPRWHQRVCSVVGGFAGWPGFPPAHGTWPP